MPANGGGKILFRHTLPAQPGLEDRARLFFHGPPVPGSLQPEARLHCLIDFANDDGRHNPMIALIALLAPDRSA